jgi:hypothetical protein
MSQCVHCVKSIELLIEHPDNLGPLAASRPLQTGCGFRIRPEILDLSWTKVALNAKLRTPPIDEHYGT